MAANFCFYALDSSKSFNKISMVWSLKYCRFQHCVFYTVIMIIESCEACWYYLPNFVRPGCNACQFQSDLVVMFAAFLKHSYNEWRFLSYLIVRIAEFCLILLWWFYCQNLSNPFSNDCHMYSISHWMNIQPPTTSAGWQNLKKLQQNEPIYTTTWTTSPVTTWTTIEQLKLSISVVCSYIQCITFIGKIYIYCYMYNVSRHI